MDKRTFIVDRKWRQALLLSALVALAVGLRLYKIDAQSLWYDEGNSARIAERSVELIIAGAAGDIHPPLYYLLLKFWRALFGSGEAALRSLSAACGVLTVLLTQRTGKLIGGERAAWAAGVLAAAAPLAVYYGQEARMYALLALCASASSWALFHALRAPRARWTALLALATACGLWTHYAYPFVMTAQGLGVLMSLRRSGRRALVHYVVANVVAIASFAPWLPVAFEQITGWSVQAQPYTVREALPDALRWILAGRTLPLGEAVPVMILFSVLACAGLFAAWGDAFASIAARLRRPGSSGSPGLAHLRRAAPGWGSDRTSGAFVVVLLQALAPLALLFVFGLYRDAYLKFLLVCTAPACLLAALGIDVLAARLQRARGCAVAAAVAVVVALLAPSLRNLYDDPAYARDDYRRIHAMIRAAGESAVVFVAPNQWEIYTYYKGDDRDLFPLQYLPAYESFAAQQLEPVAFGRARLFALYYAERDADPNGWYERWLGTHIAKIHEEWIGNIRVALYSGANDYRTVAENVQFGDALTLVRAEADLTRTDGVVPVRLTWRAERPLERRYKMFVHIGAADAPPVAQSDSEPASGYAPTDAWQPGVEVLDERGAWLKPGAPAGSWSVFVGVYDAASGERLGERLKLGEMKFFHQP